MPALERISDGGDQFPWDGIWYKEECEGPTNTEVAMLPGSRGKTTFTPAEAGVLVEWLGSLTPGEPVSDLAGAVAAYLADPDAGARDVAWGVYHEALVVKLARLTPTQQEQLRAQAVGALATPGINQALADRDEAAVAAVARAVGIPVREHR